MHAQPCHNRLRLIGNHQQNRAYRECQQCDQDDGGEGGDGRSGFGVVVEECLEGFYEACNVCEGCEGAQEGDGEYLQKGWLWLIRDGIGGRGGSDDLPKRG